MEVSGRLDPDALLGVADVLTAAVDAGVDESQPPPVAIKAYAALVSNNGGAIAFGAVQRPAQGPMHFQVCPSPRICVWDGLDQATQGDRQLGRVISLLNTPIPPLLLENRRWPAGRHGVPDPQFCKIDDGGLSAFEFVDLKTRRHPTTNAVSHQPPQVSPPDSAMMPYDEMSGLERDQVRGATAKHCLQDYGVVCHDGCIEFGLCGPQQGRVSVGQAPADRV